MRLRALLGLLLLFVALILSACGGTPPGPRLVSVEIDSGGFILSGAGDSRDLTAVAIDNTGARIEDAVIEWQSSNASAIEVDQDGHVTAVAANGSAQITAKVGNLSSSPILVTVGGLAPDAVLLPDEAFTSDPEPIDPNEELDVGTLFTVDVQSTSNLQIGDIVVSSGLTPVVGRVTNISGDTLTLEVVPIDEVFPDLDLPDQTFSLASSSPRLSSEAAEYFNTTRAADGTIRLVLKEEVALTSLAGSGELSPQQAGAFEFGPFRCATVQGSYSSATLNRWTVEYREDLALETMWSDTEKKLIAHLQPTIDLDVRVRFHDPMNGLLGCTATLFESKTPFAGALGFYLGAAIPVGVGFDAGGNLKVANHGFEIFGTVSPKISAGFTCQDETCQVVAEFEDGGTGTVRPVTPDLPDGIDSKHEIAVFAFVGIEPGILKEENGVFSRRHTSRLLTGQAGRKVHANFANRSTQALAGNDSLMRAHYQANFEAALRPGDGGIQSLNLLGLASFDLTTLPVFEVIGESPNSEVSLGAIVGVNKGNPIPLSIITTQETLKFIGDENIVRYLVYVLTDDEELIEIANILPPLGQTKTDFTWIPTHDSDDLRSFHVFVTTAFVPNQQMMGRRAGIEQDRLELVGTFELSRTTESSTTEEKEINPRPEGPPYDMEWLQTLTTSRSTNYQATVEVNAFYEDGDWTFTPSSWGATGVLARSSRETMVYHVNEFDRPLCFERENWRESRFSGAGLNSAIGGIEAVAAGTKLRFASPPIAIPGTAESEWDWPCFFTSKGLNGPSGLIVRQDTDADGVRFWSQDLDIWIDPTNPNTWVGSLFVEILGVTVSWSFTEVPEF